jgi:hypothetical protein
MRRGNELITVTGAQSDRSAQSGYHAGAAPTVWAGSLGVGAR